MTLETQKAFARRIGKDPSHITRLKQAGRLVMQGGKVDVDASLARIEATSSVEPRHLANAQRFAEERAQRREQSEQGDDGTVDQTGEQPKPVGASKLPPIEQLGAALKMETLRLQKAKAELANLEVDKAASLLVEREEVEFLLRDIGTALRITLEGVADRLAPVLMGHCGDLPRMHAEIEDAMTEVLHEIADKVDGGLTSNSDGQTP